MQAESEVRGTAKDGASKTSEDVLGEGLFGMFGCDKCPLALKLLRMFYLERFDGIVGYVRFCFVFGEKNGRVQPYFVLQ